MSKFARNEAGLILDVVQGSPEWLTLRRGKITGTMAHAIWVGGKSASDAVDLLVIEEVSTAEIGLVKTKAMKRGNALEDEARSMFEIAKADRRDVLQVGGINHKSISDFFISPDGLYKDYKNLEIKCLEAKNFYEHLKAFRDKPASFRFLDDSYNTQVQAGLSCSGNDATTCVIYNPDFPDHEYIEFDIERNDQFIRILEEKIEEALYNKSQLIKRYWR